MQPYMERARELTRESQIAVVVCLNPSHDDIEFLPFKPSASDYRSLPFEFGLRQLRPVAILGLRGLNLVCAFLEPLDACIVNSISAAFLEYIRVLLGEHFTEHMAGAEAQELNRMWMLSDHRSH